MMHSSFEDLQDDLQAEDFTTMFAAASTVIKHARANEIVLTHRRWRRSFRTRFADWLIRLAFVIKDPEPQRPPKEILVMEQDIVRTRKRRNR